MTVMTQNPAAAVATHLIPTPPPVSPPPAAAPADAGDWEYYGHRGDWFAFQVWGVCFLVLVAMNLYDLVAALFGF